MIGTVGLPSKYGGFEQLANHLTKNLHQKFDFTVYTSYTNAEPGLKEFNHSKIKIIPFQANGSQSVIYDIVSMIHAAIFSDVLFVCGTSGCVALPLIGLFGKKIILNPDGREWKRQKWPLPVKWFLVLSEMIGISFAHVLVADNRKIQHFIRKRYKKRSVLIEYGGDQVLHVPLSAKTAQMYGIEAGKYAFEVCRIEPENNIHMLLEAFKQHEKMHLMIVGNWNHSKYGKNLKQKYQGVKNLTLLDPIYDQVQLDELRSNCAIYLHAFTVGGTNPSLVEAMNLGLLIMTYDVEYNRETTEGKALYFRDDQSLLNLLIDFEEGRIDVDKYKNDMLQVAERRYKWDIITTKYSRVFRSCKSRNK